MPGDSIGKMFRVTVWGESHGPAVGAVIEGCPPGKVLNLKMIQDFLDRRKPGRNEFVTPRCEEDRFQILSGLYEGTATGTPISILIKNEGFKKENYKKLEKVFRPGHADFTYQMKYGVRDPAGGGRSSARLTAPIVAAGGVAKQILTGESGIEITAFVRKIGNIEAGKVTAADLNASIVNFPDSGKEAEVLEFLEKLQREGNSIGGVVECVVNNVPAGLGEPLFDKLDGDLAKVMVGLNGARGFEIGNGFGSAVLTGMENNDEFTTASGTVVTSTNRSGGVQGGISNGMPLVFRVAFKPAPSISMKQRTVDMEGNSMELVIHGAHDVCIAIRAVPVVEALTAIVLCDHLLRQRGQCG